MDRHIENTKARLGIQWRGQRRCNATCVYIHCTCTLWLIQKGHTQLLKLCVIFRQGVKVLASAANSLSKQLKCMHVDNKSRSVMLLGSQERRRGEGEERGRVCGRGDRGREGGREGGGGGGGGGGEGREGRGGEGGWDLFPPSPFPSSSPIKWSILF